MTIGHRLATVRFSRRSKLLELQTMEGRAAARGCLIRFRRFDRSRAPWRSATTEGTVGKASRRKKARGQFGLDLQPSPEKASTRLGELISPHIAPDETRESYGALVTLGALAWNLSLVPAGERRDLVRQAVRDARAIGLPLTEQWLNNLVHRKEKLFPDDERFIESYEVRDEGGGKFTIMVATTSAA